MFDLLFIIVLFIYLVVWLFGYVVVWLFGMFVASHFIFVAWENIGRSWDCVLKMFLCKSF